MPDNQGKLLQLLLVIKGYLSYIQTRIGYLNCKFNSDKYKLRIYKELRLKLCVEVRLLLNT